MVRPSSSSRHSKPNWIRRRGFSPRMTWEPLRRLSMVGWKVMPVSKQKTLYGVCVGSISSIFGRRTVCRLSAFRMCLRSAWQYPFMTSGAEGSTTGGTNTGICLGGLVLRLLGSVAKLQTEPGITSGSVGGCNGHPRSSTRLTLKCF
jgi:hypothetical protein